MECILCGKDHSKNGACGIISAINERWGKPENTKKRKINPKKTTVPNKKHKSIKKEKRLAKLKLRQDAARRVKFTRTWSMPNSQTFKIKPIQQFIQRILSDGIWIDPFVRNSVFKSKMTHTNDLNTKFEATHHIDALDFLKTFEDESIDGVLYDPPYSPRQIKECYDGIGRRVTQQDTQSSFWGNLKKEIARITKQNGKVISCGWQSGGIGKTLGFVLVEVLLVPHGGRHNDTIVTLEYKK